MYSHKEELKNKMDKAIGILKKELQGLRTGRASVNLLDSVVVEAYGNKMPVSQVGTISTPDAKTISVQVWDKEMVKPVLKAIAESNLGLNPGNDGQLIRITLPTISYERRQELVKIASKYGENTKIALRNIRRDAMDEIKKMEKDNQISKDQHHAYSEEVQKITDEFIGVVDNVVKIREQEILTI